ncbi:MAG: NADH-quinone oxidoreductase subunit K [Actinomycetota bacterium]
MSLLLATLVAWLFTMGTYLLLQRTLTRIVLGLGLLSHGAVLLLQTVGGRAGDPAIVDSDGGVDGIAAPLPQALALTAIVISFGATSFLLAMAYRSWLGTSDDQVQDDLEDRRIAAEVADLEGHYDRDRVDEFDPEVPT